jgi:carbonic anhydrase
VVNVCVSTVMVDAWAKGQKVTIHGWAFGVHDGLLQDLHMSVTSTDSIEPSYRAALQGVSEGRRR